jgi:hypothetical protein
MNHSSDINHGNLMNLNPINPFRDVKYKKRLSATIANWPGALEAYFGEVVVLFEEEFAYLFKRSFYRSLEPFP